MAESHSEDAPLLWEGEMTSPTECSSRSNNWSSNDTEKGLTGPWPPDTWIEHPSKDKLQVPICEEKIVKAQSSMDSGCDCDTSEAVTPHEIPTSSSVLTPTTTSSPSSIYYQPISPLSPSQPGDSGIPSPGPPKYYSYEGNHSGVCDMNTGSARHTIQTTHNNTCSTSIPSAVCSSSIQNYLEKPKVDQQQQLSSKVTFRIEGDEEDDDSPNSFRNSNGSSSNDLVDAIESASFHGSEPGEDFRNLVFNASRSFPRIPSYNKTGVLSSSSSTASMPMCRICHLPQGEGIDSLISPCRCAGTMQFIHQGCLMKWLEISSKRSKRAPACELCQYQFNRHKKFRLRHWKLPTSSPLDKILHSIFLICLVIMITCATITIICFKQERFDKKRDEAELTHSEIVTLTCGVLFFIAFFLAMYVEVKARETLFKLFCRFFYLNETWYIDEYDKRKDTQFNNNHAPV